MVLRSELNNLYTKEQAMSNINWYLKYTETVIKEGEEVDTRRYELLMYPNDEGAARIEARKRWGSLKSYKHGSITDPHVTRMEQFKL